MNVQQRRQMRAERKAKETEERARRTRRRRLITGGIAVFVAALAVWAVWAGTRPTPGIAYPDQGRDHIGLSDRHLPYDSNPPTSGWHYASPAAWGVYSQPLPDEQVVHNLEHGGIWISYRDPDAQVVEKLEALMQRFPTKLIITPRPKNDSQIALAAWGHLLKLERYDEGPILAFIRTYINRGPEDVP
jgi:hypothetical protein